jgi:alpha-beta hydrolase superfamily lysophospholipase
MNEKITFQNSKGQTLVGTLTPSDSNAPIAIFVHGYRSNKEGSKAKKLAKDLPEKGIALFAIDLSGRGESEGKFEDITLTQYIDDVKCAIDEISKRTEKIALIGSSLGGIVSLQEVTKDKRVNVLVLLSPISVYPHKNTGEYSSENIEKWKNQGYMFTESQRLGKLKVNYTYYEDGIKYNDYEVYEDIKIPVLIIHGNSDDQVPIEGSKKLLKHLENSKFIELEGADHKYTKQEDFDKVIQETTKFIQDKLK